MPVSIPSLLRGDRRMVHGVDGAIAAVEKKPALFAQLIEGMQSDDPLIRMRVAKSEQQELRWHVAQMLPRLRHTAAERRRAVSLVLGYLDDKSKIVRTFAMQALADLVMQDAARTPRVIGVIEAQMADGSPAIRARGRKLLRKLNAATNSPRL